MAAMLTSVYHLLILAMNNYVGIIRPLHYSITVTPERTVVLIVVLWLLPLFLLFFFFGIVPNQAFRSPKCGNLGFYISFNFRLVVLAVFVFPLMLMSFIYAHILLVIIKRKYLGRTPRQGSSVYNVSLFWEFRNPPPHSPLTPVALPLHFP